MIICCNHVKIYGNLTHWFEVIDLSLKFAVLHSKAESIFLEIFMLLLNGLKNLNEILLVNNRWYIKTMFWKIISKYFTVRTYMGSKKAPLTKEKFWYLENAYFINKKFN